MQKPYVIMLMMSSIDGKIDGEFIDGAQNAWLGDFYEQHKLEIAQAWGNGSNTHKMYFSDESVDLSAFAADCDECFADNVIKSELPYVVCFDSAGKVKWPNATLDYPHGVQNQVLVVTTRRAKPEYIAYLKDKGVSFVFADDESGDKIDLNIALDKLYSLFGVRRFALTGGAIINAAFIKADLVDEIRLLITPDIDGTQHATICESAKNESLSRRFVLDEVQKLQGDGLLLVYKK